MADYTSNTNLKPKNKSNRIANASTKISEEIKRAALLKVSPGGVIDYEGSHSIFILNPSSWEDVKSVNWAQHNIPGQSDPIFHFVSGGARVVSFEALVTNEHSAMDVNKIREEEIKDNLGTNSGGSTFKERISELGSMFFGLKPGKKTVSPKRSETGTLDISRNLDYYRSLTYPEYDDPKNPRRIIASPPLVILAAGSALSRFKFGDRIDSNVETWIVTNLRINITKQLANLAPMEATVSFQLMQYNLKAFSSSRFYPKTR